MKSATAVIVNDLLIVLGFISFFIPEDYAVPSIVLTGWRCAALLTSLVAFLFYFAKTGLSMRWASLMMSIICYYFISKFVKGSDGSIVRATFYAIDVGGFVTLLEYGLSKDRKRYLKLFLVAGVIMCVAHYISFLMFRNVPGGMKGYSSPYEFDTIDGPSTLFLLKHDNGSAFYFLPVMACMWHYAFRYSHKWTLAFLFSIATVYMYWSQWSVAAMLATTALFALCLWICLIGNHNPASWLSYRLALFAGIFVCVALVMLSTSSIGDWTARTFHKSIGFGRETIWRPALEAFSNSPIIGVGYETGITTTLRLGINHCHNCVVDLLYTGGIVTAFFMLYGLVLCGREKVDNLIQSTGDWFILVASVFLIFFMSSVDWYLYIPVPFAIFELVAHPYDCNEQISYKGEMGVLRHDIINV